MSCYDGSPLLPLLPPYPSSGHTQPISSISSSINCANVIDLKRLWGSFCKQGWQAGRRKGGRGCWSVGWDVEDSSWSGLCCGCRCRCCCRGIFICITCRGQMRVCWADQNQRNQSASPCLEVGRGGGSLLHPTTPLPLQLYMARCLVFENNDQR